MLRYLVRRTLYAVPILIGTCLITFALFFVVVSPTQLARRNIRSQNPSPQQIRDWVHERGYDRPRSQQFARYTGDLLRFRFGRSDASRELIWDKLRAGVGPSLMVAVPTFFAGLLTAVVFAVFVAYYRASYLDLWGTFLCVLLMSISYLVYIMAGQFVLGKVLKYFPMAGYLRGPHAVQFILLPTVIGVLAELGALVRFYRTALLDEMGQDYVRTARAKGVPERLVLFRHVLKNASIPILTSAVMSIPYLLLGSILLESFFAIPGLGTMTVDAIFNDDFPLVRAMVFIGTLLYVVGAVLTDVSYALVNPRVRLE
jgi:peptide/nickel transport system permease protein